MVLASTTGRQIVELDSPFASVVASGTQVYTFLLLGDQNAGKYDLVPLASVSVRACAVVWVGG